MDQANIINPLLQLNWAGIVFKIIAVLFSVGYLGYGLIFQQQIVKMEKNALIYYYLLEHPDEPGKPPKPLLFSFSLLQLFIGVILLIMSLLVV